MATLHWIFLGRVPYPLGLSLQQAQASRVRAGADPILFLLEHPKTITLGRSADPGHLRLGEQELARRGFGVYRVARGGDVTYHGPGQLVGYPVAALPGGAGSVPRWVRAHAGALIAFLKDHGIDGTWSDLHPGVWVGREKIGALGFQISRGVSTHGFALNICPDLAHFDTIVPCGLSRMGVTSMAALGSRVPTLEEAAERVAFLVARQLGWTPGEALDSGEVLEEFADDVSLSACL